RLSSIDRVWADSQADSPPALSGRRSLPHRCRIETTARCDAAVAERPSKIRGCSADAGRSRNNSPVARFPRQINPRELARGPVKFPLVATRIFPLAYSSSPPLAKNVEQTYSRKPP